MNPHVRVSYIVATYNRAKFLPLAIERWRALKGPQDELIVVDGHSTDGSYELLSAVLNDVVDLLIHEKDKSEAHAFNKGMLAARGDYIKLLSDDDVFFRDGLEAAYSTLAQHPEIDILYTGGEFVTCEEGSDVVLEKTVLTQPDISEQYWMAWMCGLGAVIRRTSLSVIGLLDPRHKRADMSLNIQALVRGANARFLCVQTFQRRLHRDSTTTKLGGKGRFGAFAKDGWKVLRDLNAPLQLRPSWRAWNALVHFGRRRNPRTVGSFSGELLPHDHS